MIRASHRTPNAGAPQSPTPRDPAATPGSNAPGSGNGGGATDGLGGHVCPFCGLTREIIDDFDPATPCPRCTLADTPSTRNATKLRVGPWHVRQVRNPWAPGMRFDTLLALIKRGQVTRDSIVRGPTTSQLWKRASEIRGLSREFGVCYACGEELDTQASACAHCNRLQEPPANPDALIEARDATLPTPVSAPMTGTPAAAGVASPPPSASGATPTPAAVSGSAPSSAPSDPSPAPADAIFARAIMGRAPGAGNRLAADPAANGGDDEPASIEIASSGPTSSIKDLADLLAVTDEHARAMAEDRTTAPRAEKANRDVTRDPVFPPRPAKPAAGAKPSDAKLPDAKSPGAMTPNAEPSAGPARRPADRREPSPPAPRRSPAPDSSSAAAAQRPAQSADAEHSEEEQETQPPVPRGRPMTIRPMTPGADDALLTPQELAAAFQLDFSPPKGRPRRGSKLAGTLLVMLLVAGGVGALFYLRPDIRAGASQWTGDAVASAKGYWAKWGEESKTVAAPPAASPRTAPSSSKPEKVAGRPTPSAAPASSGAVATAAPATRPKPIVIAPPKPVEPPATVAVLDEEKDEDKPAPVKSAGPRSGETVAASPKTSVAAAPAIRSPDVATSREADAAEDAERALAESSGGAVTAATTQSPLHRQSLPLAATSSPSAPRDGADAIPAPKAAATRPVVVTPPALPVPRPAAGPSSEAKALEAALNEARRLYTAAITAEGNQDYVEAVRCYEAIKRLPVDARAMGVDLRLERARKLAR